MRPHHLAATILLLALTGCTAGATVAASGTPTPAPFASPTAAPTAAPTPAPTASPSAAACSEVFVRYDVDKDATLSYDEYANGRWGDIRFVRAPTEQEVADGKARFREDARKADADGDGKLTCAEFAATSP